MFKHFRYVAGSIFLASTLLIAAGCTTQSGDRLSALGEIRIGMVGSSIDEQQPYAQHSSFSGNAVYAQAYEGLTTLDSDGNVVYKLAESMVPNETLDVWTIKIREDIKTHNGEAFAADDVAESIHWMVDPENAWGVASQLDFVDPAGISVTGEHTLELKLKKPYGPLPEAFSMTRLLMRSLKGDATFEKPAGTGPFKIDSFSPGQEASLSRFDQYWGDPATLTSVVFSFFQEQAAVTNAIRGGQIDIAQGIPFPEMPAIKKENDLKVLVSDTATYPLMTMRLDIEPTNDKRVREAMRLLVDRERIVANAFGGYATLGNDFIARNSPCADPKLPQRKQDLDRASALLREAGAEGLSFELATDAAFPGMVEMAQLYAEDAAKVGVDVTVRKLDVSTFLNQWLEWPFFIGFTSTPYLVSATGHFSPGGSENGSHMDDAEYNEIAARLYATADATKQCEYISQLRTIEYERGGYIIPVYGQDITVHNKKVVGLHPDVYGRASYTLAGVTIE